MGACPRHVRRIGHRRRRANFSQRTPSIAHHARRTAPGEHPRLRPFARGASRNKVPPVGRTRPGRARFFASAQPRRSAVAPGAHQFAGIPRTRSGQALAAAKSRPPKLLSRRARHRTRDPRQGGGLAGVRTGRHPGADHRLAHPTGETGHADGEHSHAGCLRQGGRGRRSRRV